ncbi:MAG: sigma-54-dependent Fis family transcriptional regulator [Planctomycetes bacterium]|nr:sigma-54-dependent Fis family transcriptional regulator [Planctomycetota bacterium]
MHTWPTRVGSVLQMLDPSVGPRLVLERLWLEVANWNTIGGIWLNVRSGHLTPSGVFMVGDAIANAAEVAALASPNTAPIETDGLPVVARQLRDGNVPIATLMVSHKHSEDAAAFIVDVLSRWCTDRLRLQLEASELAEENQILRGALSIEVKQHDILTNSGVMNSLIQSAVRAAASTATVLVQGETGTGKELLAKLIHSHSHRAHKPMVSINAGALSPTLLESELFGHARGAFTGADHERKGLFEVANGGTLFLDEVGEIGAEAQVRLLRVLQEKTITRVGDHKPLTVDVRIIAATHRDLAKDVADGRFREDLFYRLNVVNLLVPPLRSRREDIPLLINHFLQKYNRQNYKNVDDVPRHVLELLINYPWPGNIRELENCVQKAVVLAPGNTFVDDLIPPTIRSYTDSQPRDNRSQMAAAQSDPSEALNNSLERYAEAAGPDINAFFQRAEKLLIIFALNRERGVKLRAAKILGINRVTLDRKLVEYTIHVKRGKGVVPEGTSGDGDGDGESEESAEDGPARLVTA